MGLIDMISSAFGWIGDNSDTIADITSVGASIGDVYMQNQANKMTADIENRKMQLAKEQQDQNLAISNQNLALNKKYRDQEKLAYIADRNRRRSGLQSMLDLSNIQKGIDTRKRRSLGGGLGSLGLGY